MEERLDEHVDAVLSSRRSAEQPAVELSRLSREQQEFVLHWVNATTQTHAEMAYQFAAVCPFRNATHGCQGRRGVHNSGYGRL